MPYNYYISSVFICIAECVSLEAINVSMNGTYMNGYNILYEREEIENINGLTRSN